MSRSVRFATFIREMSVKHRVISGNDVLREIQEQGATRPAKLQLRGIDITRLLQPYISVRLTEQVRAVMPLAVYLVLFQLLILRQDINEPWTIAIGLVAVMLGLMLFMEGLKLGLMPFGEVIGNTLPARASLQNVLLIAFLLGIGVTFAEPAIGVLKTAGSFVPVESAPYLYALLNDWAETLVLVVGVGVGLAAVLGTLRFLYGWSLKPLIYLSLVPSIGLTGYITLDPELSKILGLAWDCGAVTTGPVTVPLVLSLGIGIAAAAGKGDSSLSGFGIVTLASLFPIIGVMLLALYVASVTTPEAIIAGAGQIVSSPSGPSWFEQTPGQEIFGGIRAIVPLVVFLLIIMKLVLRERLSHKGIIGYGISLCVFGMIIFSLGLSYGLAQLGSQSGSLVPAAFTQIKAVSASPLYIFSLGIPIAIIFAWLLGFGATLAEPALNALGVTVESLTNGAFRKSMLIYAVSIGVGCGITLGVLKIIFSLPLAWLLIPSYMLAVVLTYFSTEEFVNVAWDSAGVTTGPVTVPLVLAMGLGLGNAVGAIEGFGILSMASICPILSVLTTGLWVQLKIRRKHAQVEHGALGVSGEAE